MLPTIDQLCKGKDGVQIKRVLSYCKRMRGMNRFHSNGYTKKRTHRYLSEIPVEIALNNGSPLKMFFPKGERMDKKERNKLMRDFLRRYPEFLVVERM